MPKNNLVLTDVRVSDESGEKIKDKGEIIRKWATELRVEPAPIIFEGYLTDKQKEKILDYIKLTPKELEDRYGNQTFSEFLIRTLNPNINSSFLQEEGIFRPDSIIFRFKKKDGGSYVAKTIDPLLASNADMNHEVPESSVPSDLYSIALMDIYAFVIENGLGYKLKERTPEFRYLELVCLVFNDFIEANMDRYEGVDFSEPSFLKNKDFDLNRRFIDNKRTLELMSMNRSYEQLFKIMLAGLRKKRRRTYGLLTHTMINQINLLIDEIREIVDVPIVEGFMDFSTFKIFKDDVSNKFVDLDVLNQIEDEEDEVPKRSATVMVVRPKIFTKELERKIRDTSEFNNVFVICVPSEECEFDPAIMKSQFDGYVGSNRDAKGCHMCDDLEQIKQMIEEIAKDYDIDATCCTTDCVNWLSDGLGHEVGDIGYLHDESNAMEYIQSDDFSRFKSICPTYINSMYMGMQKDLERTKKIDYRI
jgi:hypothetical protein